MTNPSNYKNQKTSLSSLNTVTAGTYQPFIYTAPRLPSFSIPYKMPNYTILVYFIMGVRMTLSWKNEQRARFKSSSWQMSGGLKVNSGLKKWSVFTENLIRQHQLPRKDCAKWWEVRLRFSEMKNLQMDANLPKRGSTKGYSDCEDFQMGTIFLKFPDSNYSAFRNLYYFIKCKYLYFNFYFCWSNTTMWQFQVKASYVLRCV